MPRDRSRMVLAAFFVGSLLAGGNSVGIRFSNRELAPLWGAGLRFSLAAILLLGIMAVMRVAVPRGRALAGAVLYGALSFAGAFGLYSFALVHIHAGLGQTLLALAPLATLLLAVLQRQERIRVAAAIGTVLALAGVGVVSGGSLGESFPLTSLLAILGAVLCFAEAAVLARRLPPMHPVALNAVAMTAGGALLAAAAAIAGEPLALPQRATTWAALAYIVPVGSVIVFLLYLFVLRNWPASRAAYVFVIIPFVTVSLSAWLDQEQVGLELVAGGLLIIAGVYMGALRRARPATG